MRTTHPVLLLTLILALAASDRAGAQVTVIRKSAQELIEAIGRIGGRDASRELAELGGEAAVRQVAERALRQGGDDAVETLVRLTRTHGPDAIRAAENSRSIPAVLKALDELPEEMAGPAVRRLAAGADGRALAEITERFGAGALRAEVRHPGVGGHLVRDLGDDGVRLAERLNTPQAIQVARHSEDLASLPAQQREGILRLLHDDAERMVSWMGRFATDNPGKVLFTAATTAIILANAERVLGGGEIVFDAEGNPTYVRKPGLLEGVAGDAVSKSLSFILPIIAVGLAGWIGIKLWYVRSRERSRNRFVAGTGALDGEQEDTPLITRLPSDGEDTGRS